MIDLERCKRIKAMRETIKENGKRTPFKEIAEAEGIGIKRVRDLYQRAVWEEEKENTEREFSGLDWIPAYGIYKEGIKTKKQLEQLSDDVILYILNKQYFGERNERKDLLKKVKVFLGRI